MPTRRPESYSMQRIDQEAQGCARMAASSRRMTGAASGERIEE